MLVQKVEGGEYSDLGRHPRLVATREGASFIGRNVSIPMFKRRNLLEIYHYN
jgi:hypothetical protein